MNRTPHRSLIATTLALGLLLTACTPTADRQDPTPTSSTSIATDGGYTQPEQLKELGQVAEAMEARFGQDYLLPNGNTWTLEDHHENIRPIACTGDSHRYRVIFEYSHGLPREEVYAAGEAITAELGLTPNANNHTSSTEMDRPAVFGAGNSEGRFLEVRGDDSHIEVFYQTRCSDHHTMYETFERFAEEHRQERRERNPGPSELLEREEHEQENDG
ncbi:hypothetical protein [Nesterenkonia sp. K-15-9-6]|uniref:hypothetical protein n=1 Tax=Nesterenkonia sp. K-15-9-6 TaxID=3093918 RepID=UPI00404464F7